MSFKRGDRVIVLDIHADDGAPYVKVGDVVELTDDATPYRSNGVDVPGYVNLYANGGVTYASIGTPVLEGVERVRDMQWSDGRSEPAPDPAVAVVDNATAYEIRLPPVPVPPFMSTDSATRKLMPVASGVLKYFPDSQMLKAWISRVGNDKHNPGEPLHWAKGKSADEPDAEVRHMLDFFRGLPADRGLEPLAHLGHLASKAWRADADLQRACDEARAAYERGEDWRK
jgi:hypothetical protein